MDKFDECVDCKWRRTDVCEDCDVGEQFEDAIEDDGLRLNNYEDYERVA